MQRITGMYMSFNGVTNDAVGAKLLDMPIRQHPVLTGERKTLPGRDGFLYINNGGYGAVTVKVDLMVPNSEDLPAVLNWLNGSGRLIFGDDPSHYYDAYVLTQFTRAYASNRLDAQKLTSVTFTCQPFTKAVTETDKVITSSGTTFNGDGHVEAYPLIKIEGATSSEMATLTINGSVVHVALTSGTPLYIDCEAGLAYTVNGSAKVYAGSSVSLVDDFPTLRPYTTVSANYNLVSFSGGITQVTLTPHWRWF